MGLEKVTRCPTCGSWQYAGRCTSHGPSTSSDDDDSNWRLEARCVEYPLGDHDPWYDADSYLNDAALAVCQACPVRRPCLEDGLREDHGIWGGWPVADRIKLRTTLDATRSTFTRDALLHRAAIDGPSYLNRNR